jgi:DNA methylase N-4/N-6
LEKVNEEFKNLKVEDKKRVLIELIDKNKLYINYSDIEDEKYSISEEEKTFTNSFYKGDIK